MIQDINQFFRDGECGAMNAYKTYAEVDSSGRLVLDSLPFQKGVLLEVLIVDQSMPRDEKVSSWQTFMRHSLCARDHQFSFRQNANSTSTGG